jgi:N-terminal acetyltransferase B complex non-catalytic subunit
MYALTLLYTAHCHSHYLSDRSIALGQFDQLADTLSMACSIYKANEIETPEMVVKAYQYATFSKVTQSTCLY